MREDEGMTLTEFLLARIADDEALARDAERVGRPPWYGKQVEYEWSNGRGESGVKAEQCVVWNDGGQSIMRTASGHDASVGYHIARHDPARILAECAAKRVAVDEYGNDWIVMDPTIRAMAAVYADHPDYRDEWRP